jgi:hypothetical protein
MKTLATLVLSVSATFAVNSAALAEAFNERGELFPATVQVGSGTASAAEVATPGFNERGIYFTATVPAGSAMPRSTVFITSTGFNDRGQGYPG